MWENVPGAFSSNKGEDFRIVLEEIVKIIVKDAVIPMPPKNKWSTSGAIVGDGWSIAWRVLDAQFWGVPQRRRRIALVADFGGGCAQEILFVRKSLRGHFEESRTERESVAEDAQGCTGIHDRDGKTYGFPLGFRPENVRCYEEKATTLCVGTRAGFCNGVISLEPGIASREGGHIYEDVSGTLRANAGDNQMSVAYSIENHPADSRVNIDESGKVQTLTSRMGTGGGNVPMVMVEGVDCYNQTITGDKAKSLTNSATDSDNIPCVVKAISAKIFPIHDEVQEFVDDNNADAPHQQDLLQTSDDVARTLCSGTHASGSHLTKTVINYGTHYVVRRLTPLECERLQGFADGWTDIGEYTDSKGKKKKTSDSARYKALGNSIALPPWKWVIKRLCSHYERDATMASLFDGIGGFPCLWEQINGKGTALWASEIEDFPIAVTKARIE